MSREIMFRIWDDSRKEWLGSTDNDVLTYYGFHLVGEVMTVQAPPQWALDPHCVVEQFTGLKDKNSKEIYEGDIVSVHNKNHKDEYDIGVVEFGKGAFRCPFLLGKYRSGQVEVIGNVHENPELLNVDPITN